MSKDIGVSLEETKELVDVALLSTDPRDVNYQQLKEVNWLFESLMHVLKDGQKMIS